MDPQRLSSFSDGRESIGKDREFCEHGGEPFDQRQQSHSGIVGINSKSMLDLLE